MRVTIRDIANALGISSATVSLALNGSPLVKGETAERVKLQAERMGYAPNPYARNLARRRSGNIGLIVPDIRNAYYATLVNHINLLTAAAGYQLTILISNESLENEQQMVRNLLQYDVEAILLAPVNQPPQGTDYIDMLNSLSIPLVFTTARYPGTSACCVMSDLEMGMSALMQHVLRQKPSSTALLTGPRGVATLDIREDVYRRTIESNALTPKVIRMDRVSYEDTHAAVLEMNDLPKYLICVNDMMAIGALNALSERGFAVPDALRVTGFDDGLYARVSATPLTTVRQNIPEIARVSVETALSLIAQEPSPERDKRIPCELFIRRSTQSMH